MIKSRLNSSSKMMGMAAWFGVGLLAIGVPSVFLHERILFMSDSLMYIEGARSLAKGLGYTANGSPITIWPPGYSLVLSMLVRVGLDSVVAFKVLNVILSLTVVLLSAMTFRRLIGNVNAWVMALASSLCFPWVYYTQAILAEMLFSVAVWLFLLAGVSFMVTLKRKWFWVATFAAMLAPVIRMAGVALWIPWLWISVLAAGRAGRGSGWFRSWVGWGGSVLLVATPLLLFYLRNLLLSEHMTGYALGVSPEYALSVKKIGITEHTLLTRLWVNLRGYTHIFIIPDQVGIARLTHLSWTVSAGCLSMWVLVGAGWVYLARTREGRLIVTLTLVYLSLLLLNIWYDVRYLLPLFPVIVAGLGIGCGFLLAGIQRLTGFPWLFNGKGYLRDLSSRVTLILVAFSVLNLAFIAVSPQARKLRDRAYADELQRLYEACRFIREQPAPGNILTGTGGGFVEMWSGRKVVSVLSMVDKQSGSLSSTNIPDGVRFILYDETNFSPYRKTYLDPIIQLHKTRLQPAFGVGKTLVYLYEPGR
jgi:hypothetical protein